MNTVPALTQPYASSLSARMALIASFSVLTAVGAQIEVPHYPVPFTLQTLFVLLAGTLLGKRDGAISQVVYLVAGIAGAPVFAGWGAGLARLLGPTGGYLLAFPIAAFAAGYLTENSTRWYATLAAVIVALLTIFSLGTVQLHFTYFHDWLAAFNGGFLIFSWWDALKIAAAVSITQRFAPLLRAGKDQHRPKEG